MIPVETFRELFDYYYWARDRQFEACAPLSEDDYRRNLDSSFNSVGETFWHLLATEFVWQTRWTGRPFEGLPGFGDVPTVEALRERWRPVESGTREFLAGLTDETLRRPLRYTNLSGKEFSPFLWQSLYHFLNHQSYHRGQITALLRQLRAEVVSVDFSNYLAARR